MPESQKEVEDIIARCNASGDKLRVVGSALSPNGIAFSSQSMISMSLLDSILDVNSAKKQVRVQCGARVEAVVEAIRPHGLTLQNYASIKEQQIGGFVQIGAHGTGLKIPPVDEQVISLKLVTPEFGTMELSRDDPDPSLFYLVRVGLGCFGVVTEVTLQCVEEHKLVEKSFVSNFKEIKKNHSKWLVNNRHLRYMWIPHTDSVVVVQCNPLTSWNSPRKLESDFSPLQRTEPIRKLISTRAVDGKVGDYTLDQLEELTFTQLRDVALAEDPLNVDWVKKVNKAEEAFWKMSEGYRVGWSDEILGFDCGGQQWVLEVAIPTGKISKPSQNDLRFVDDVLKLINRFQIAAPAPLEQRWSSSSRSRLSPVYSDSTEDVFSWLGIIMYLPTDDPKQRQKITAKFGDYARNVEVDLLPKYNGMWHWGKLEIDRLEHKDLKKQILDKFPLEYVNEQRKRLDPKNILGNRITDIIFVSGS
eukprot:g497.t1